MSSRFRFIRQSFRARLLLLAVVVEALMLTLLIGNSMRLVWEAMTEQVKDHANQIGPVLNAALVAPLAQRDYATVQAIIDESRAHGGVLSLLVMDAWDQRVAASGWAADRPVPKIMAGKDFDESAGQQIFVSKRPLELAGQRLGTLYFTLDLSRVAEARRSLFSQGALIALVELALSTGLLTLLGWWMTRNLSALREASEAVAQGNLTPPPVPDGLDEIGRLGAAFNAMSQAVAERVYDITAARDEQTRLKEVARQEHARLIALISAMDLGVLLLDPYRHVVFSNAAFHRIWQVDGSCALNGRSAMDVFAKSGARPVSGDPIPFDGPLAASRGGSAPVELTLQDGRILTRRSRLVTETDGKVTGLLWIFEDVTRAKQSEQRLLEALQAAEAASEAKIAFLATMSHEIRTPMNGIIGMTSLVLDSGLSDEQKEQLSWVKSSADSLLAILNDILDFAKIDAQRLSLERIPFDLDELVRSCLGLYSVIAHEKGVTLHQPETIYGRGALTGDPVRLRQVINNLLSNALKFTPAGGWIRLGVQVIVPSPEGGVRLEFSISDSGVGIPADKLEHIFSPFEQVDSSTTRRFGGTGLGLAIVARLVALMEGEISVESRENVGSTFRFTAHFGEVPLAAVTATEASHFASMPALDGSAPVALQAPIQPLEPPKILLVEDTPVNQVLAQAILRKNGYQVTLARDGVEALARLEVARFDLILMDIQMPNMDGLEASRCIRAAETRTGGHVPIIALTANAMAQDREECEAAGMDDFVSKPFQVEEMLAAIKRHLPR